MATEFEELQAKISTFTEEDIEHVVNLGIASLRPATTEQWVIKYNGEIIPGYRGKEVFKSQSAAKRSLTERFKGFTVSDLFLTHRQTSYRDLDRIVWAERVKETKGVKAAPNLYGILHAAVKVHKEAIIKRICAAATFERIR